MKIHKETIASELELLINGVNSKKQTVEEIAAYIRWRDKELILSGVSHRREQFVNLIKWLNSDETNELECNSIDGVVDAYLKLINCG